MNPEIPNDVVLALESLNALINLISSLRSQHGVTDEQIATHAKTKFADNAVQIRAALASVS